MKILYRQKKLNMLFITGGMAISFLKELFNSLQKVFYHCAMLLSFTIYLCAFLLRLFRRVSADYSVEERVPQRRLAEMHASKTLNSVWCRMSTDRLFLVYSDAEASLYVTSCQPISHLQCNQLPTYTQPLLPWLIGTQ